VTTDPVLTVERVMAAPVVVAHRAAVLDAASAKIDQLEKAGVLSGDEALQVKGWFKELPFRRVVDVELSFLSGLPDTIGLCLEANPSAFLAIDACAGTIALITSFSVHATSRLLHYTNITAKTNADGSVSYWGDTIGVGPSLGYRHMVI